MWKKEYFENYFNNTNEYYDRVIESNNIKNENKPPYLYKYTKAEYGIEILKNNFIKMSKPNELNDINEGNLIYSSNNLYEYNQQNIAESFIQIDELNFTEEDKKNIRNSSEPLNKLTETIYFNNPYLPNNEKYKDFEIDIKNIYKEYQEKIIENFNDNLKEHVYIISFSEKKDNQVMWGNYADNFKGVCIEYNFRNNENNNKKSKKNPIIEEDFLNDFCNPVNYVEETDSSEDLKDIYNLKNKLKLLEKPFLTKFKEWDYEKEWRILINQKRFHDISTIIDLKKFFKKDSNISFLKIQKPNAIYLESKINEDCETNIKNICKENGITIYKMLKNKKTYDLKFEEIN